MITANEAILWSDLRAIIAIGNNNGDCLVWDGDSFISNSISLLTGGGKDGLSHASLLGYLPKPFDSVVVAESNFTDNQLVFRSVTDKLIQQHGTAYWLRTTMTPEQRADLWCDVAKREINFLKYDTVGLIQYGSSVLFPWAIKPPKLKDNTAFCSAMCQYEWAKVKYIQEQLYAWPPQDIPKNLCIEPVKVVFDINNVTWRRSCVQERR